MAHCDEMGFRNSCNFEGGISVDSFRNVMKNFLRQHKVNLAPSLLIPGFVPGGIPEVLLD